MRGSKNCTFLPPFGQLPSLKELSIQDMDNVKVVGSEFLGNGVSFPSLEVLSFVRMPQWEAWSTNGGSTTGVVRNAVFPCLKELHIKDCPSLVEFSFKGDKVFPFLQELCMYGCSNLLEVSVEALASLRVLRIHGCGDGVLRSVVRAAPSVTEVEIESISGLTKEVWRGVILDLKAVEKLEVISCDEIRYLWESKEAEASSNVLINLRKLKVWVCKNLVSLGEKDEEYNYGSNLLTSLSSLEVYSCDNLKHLSCPSNIEKLKISVHIMLYVVLTTGVVRDAVFPRLKKLHIIRCPSLVEFSFKGDKVFPFLQELCIEGCSNLLEVSVEALPSLRVLRIDGCGDGVLRSVVRVAPSVTEVEIESISGLTNEVWKGVILDLKAVEELKVKYCHEIRYLWESTEGEAGNKVLVNLRKLKVWRCKNLVS
ncbi:NB-ARC domains-containing protein [Tanacetum coccineum]